MHIYIYIYTYILDVKMGLKPPPLIDHSDHSLAKAFSPQPSAAKALSPQLLKPSAAKALALSC